MRYILKGRLIRRKARNRRFRDGEYKATQAISKEHGIIDLRGGEKIPNQISLSARARYINERPHCCFKRQTHGD